MRLAAGRAQGGQKAEIVEPETPRDQQEDLLPFLSQRGPDLVALLQQPVIEPSQGRMRSANFVPDPLGSPAQLRWRAIGLEEHGAQSDVHRKRSDPDECGADERVVEP